MSKTDMSSNSKKQDALSSGYPRWTGGHNGKHAGGGGGGGDHGNAMGAGGRFGAKAGGKLSSNADPWASTPFKTRERFNEMHLC